MPRKKTTHGRPKNCENADPDASLMADSSNESALKKETFLRDFDMQVQDRVSDMEEKKKAMIKEISRMFLSEKLKIKKEIRQMTVKEFIEKGGDLKVFDFTSVSTAAVQDISFVGGLADDTVMKAPTAISTVTRTTRKRGAVIAESPLVQDAPMTRTRGRGRKATNMSLVTPSITRYNGMPMKTPLITPKFDPRKPLTVAREPKRGETLMSLQGSPVVQNNDANSSTPGNLLSLRLDSHQTLLGGLLFDETMSPRTLSSNKERLEEAIGAINSRLGELSTQFSSQSSSGLQITNS